METQMVTHETFGGALFGPSVQRLLAANMDPGVLRPWYAKDGRAYVTVNGKNHLVANATLRKEEWLEIDSVIVKASRQRLVAVQALLDAGLSKSIDGMSNTVTYWETATDFTAATVSMDGASKGTKDRPDYTGSYMPLPIVHKEFAFSARVINASRKGGESLDMDSAERAARVVAEAQESMLLVGTGGITAGGGTIYGLLNHTSRNTGSLTASWTASAATGAGIIGDVLNMKQALHADYFYGPYILFIPGNYDTVLDEDYQTGYAKTIRQRISEIGGIQKIVVCDKLTDSNVVMAQATPDVMRMIVGLAPTTLQWETDGGMRTEFKVMSIMVPQIRAEANGRCGVVHYS